MTLRPVRLAMIAIASAGILLLSGCTTELFPSVEHSSQPTGESVPAAVAPYYHQVLGWKNCGKSQQCATATAPIAVVAYLIDRPENLVPG